MNEKHREQTLVFIKPNLQKDIALTMEIMRYICLKTTASIVAVKTGVIPYKV